MSSFTLFFSPPPLLMPSILLKPNSDEASPDQAMPKPDLPTVATHTDLSIPPHPSLKFPKTHSSNPPHPSLKFPKTHSSSPPHPIYPTPTNSSKPVPEISHLNPTPTNTPLPMPVPDPIYIYIFILINRFICI